MMRSGARRVRLAVAVADRLTITRQCYGTPESELTHRSLLTLRLQQ